LRDNPDVIEKLLAAHVNETMWINEHIHGAHNNASNEKPNSSNSSSILDVVNAFNDGLKQVTGKTIPNNELKEALTKMDFTYDPLKASLYKIADDANSLGFLKSSKSNTKLDISGIYDLNLLNKVLQKRGLSTVR
jgi:NitT/TauT family transport system substrate-binding protein